MKKLNFDLMKFDLMIIPLPRFLLSNDVTCLCLRLSVSFLLRSAESFLPFDTKLIVLMVEIITYSSVNSIEETHELKSRGRVS